jgi:hypothetical protein
MQEIIHILNVNFVEVTACKLMLWNYTNASIYYMLYY